MSFIKIVLPYLSHCQFTEISTNIRAIIHSQIKLPRAYDYQFSKALHSLWKPANLGALLTSLGRPLKRAEVTAQKDLTGQRGGAEGNLGALHNECKQEGHLGRFSVFRTVQCSGLCSSTDLIFLFPFLVCLLLIPRNLSKTPAN